MNAGVFDFCLQEARAALIGTTLAHTARWMSHPAAIWCAEHKAYQLQIARECGFLIPETVITNDPDVIRKAFAAFGKMMIVKPTHGGYVDYGHEQRAVYTSQVLEEHMSEAASASLSPAIYQRLIPKKSDLRVTVVGNEAFTAEIHSQRDPAASVDWRRTSDPNLPHSRFSLPEAIQSSVHALMAKLNLQFGAIDLIRTEDEKCVFLEVNPNGQWLWLDDMLDFDISSSIARWLAGEDKK
jgi:glutathione synthase/RimK-type ligase-like ATP-grasp enzyme